MKKIIALEFLFLSFLLHGCTTMHAVWNPSEATSENDIVRLSLKPGCNSKKCYGFQLNINNKTDKPLEIDWNKSYYLLNGQTNGGLMTTGVVISQRNLLRPPDIILPRGGYDKPVWPSSFTNLQIDITSVEWINSDLPEGKQGVYLTFRQGNREEFLTAEIVNQGVENPRRNGPSLKIFGVNIINGD